MMLAAQPVSLASLPPWGLPAIIGGVIVFGMLLLVVAAAVRSNAVDRAAVPPLGVSAAVGALGVLGLQLVLAAWLRIQRQGIAGAWRGGTSGV